MPVRHQRGRYLIRNLIGVGYVAALDLALRLTVRRREQQPKEIKRILVAIGGHLGDAVIASSVLPAIRAALPHAQIGILAPSWMQQVLGGHPLVMRFHTVDHWKGNRSSESRLAKWRTFTATVRQAIDEIAEAHYDVAVDLYPFYPNMSLILLRAGVPVRVGYESGGGGPAYTRALQWIDGSVHMASRFARVLEGAGIPASGAPKYSLPPLSHAVEKSVARLMSDAGIRRGEYVVLHTGTGHPSKALAVDKWERLVGEYLDQGHKVVLTGHGAADRATADKLIAMHPAIVDLVGGTSIKELRGILRHAHLVVGVDSVAVHLAAAEGTRSISVVTADTDVEQWRPLAANAEVRNAESLFGARLHA